MVPHQCPLPHTDAINLAILTGPAVEAVVIRLKLHARRVKEQLQRCDMLKEVLAQLTKVAVIPPR